MLKIVVPWPMMFSVKAPMVRPVLPARVKVLPFVTLMNDVAPTVTPWLAVVAT